jgi:hypothetical protein
MKQARPWMLANLKIICQFHAHPLHQNSVDIFWEQVEHVRGHLWHRYSVTVKHNQVMAWFGYMVLYVTFNNISVISAMSWLSVLLVEETAVPGENHRPVAYHIMLYRVHLAWVGFDLTTLVVIDTDYTDSLDQTTIRSRPRPPPPPKSWWRP